MGGFHFYLFYAHNVHLLKRVNRILWREKTSYTASCNVIHLYVIQAHAHTQRISRTIKSCHKMANNNNCKKTCWSNNNKNNSTKPIVIVFLFVIFRFAFANRRRTGEREREKEEKYDCWYSSTFTDRSLRDALSFPPYICCSFHAKCVSLQFAAAAVVVGIDVVWRYLLEASWLFSSIAFGCLFALFGSKFRGFRFCAA